jgi:hypothetical protein
MPCTPFDVEVTIVTPDQTKKITFGLARSCNNDGSESWKINFELDEKNGAATDFQLVAKVTVTVGKDDHAAATAVAQAMDQNKPHRPFRPPTPSRRTAATPTVQPYKPT